MGETKPRSGEDLRYMSQEDRPRKRKAVLFSILTILSGLLYFIWVVYNANYAHPFMVAYFMAAEVACLGLFLLATYEVRRLRFKPPQGLGEAGLKEGSVDVFIVTCGEPLRVVSKTLRAAKDIRWSGRLKVFVLDDGNSPELRAFSESLGFEYATRQECDKPSSEECKIQVANAKAGNLNYGLALSSGDYILVLDADQVPKPNIVEVLMGYMKFPQLGFIQSRQDYLVPEHDPFYNQDNVFYDTVQSAWDDSNSVMSCGSGVLYRRRALLEVGCFATWNLVEDLTTSYQMHANGWKSFYYPHSLTTGLAPDSIAGVYRQRKQWGVDTMRLMFYDSPLFKKGLSFRQRVGYMTIGLAYFCSAFVFPFFYIIPLWTYVTGNFIFVGSVWEFLFLRLIYFVLMGLGLHYLFWKREPGKQFKMLMGIFPVYIWSTLQALFHPPGRKPEYKVNDPLGRGRRKTYASWVYVLPQLALFVANAVLPYLAVWLGTAPVAYVAANVPVSAVAMWSLWQVLDAALGRKRWHPERDPEKYYEQPVQS